MVTDGAHGFEVEAALERGRHLVYAPVTQIGGGNDVEAALSKEAVRLFERVARKRIRYLYTTAFSNNFESMKYRGLFKLHNRTEAGPSATDPYQKRFKINYEAEAGKWTLADGLKLWKQKHGETSQDANKDYQD